MGDSLTQLEQAIGVPQPSGGLDFRLSLVEQMNHDARQFHQDRALPFGETPGLAIDDA